MLSPSQRSTQSTQSTTSYQDVLDDMNGRLQLAKDNLSETKAVISDVLKESKNAKKVVVLNSAIKALKKVNNYSTFLAPLDSFKTSDTTAFVSDKLSLANCNLPSMSSNIS